MDGWISKNEKREPDSRNDVQHPGDALSGKFTHCATQVINWTTWKRVRSAVAELEELEDVGQLIGLLRVSEKTLKDEGRGENVYLVEQCNGPIPVSKKSRRIHRMNMATVLEKAI